MLDLADLGKAVAARRRSLKLTQPALAALANVGMTSIDELENGRARELGFTKVSRILSALDMGLRLIESPRARPTLVARRGDPPSLTVPMRERPVPCP